MKNSYEFQNLLPEIISLADIAEKSDDINTELYSKFDVKRGLRDINGKGVLCGLTQISEICSSEVINGETVYKA